MADDAMPPAVRDLLTRFAAILERMDIPIERVRAPRSSSSIGSTPTTSGSSTPRGEAEGIEAKIVGAYLGVRRGDDDWPAAVRSLADSQQAVDEALAWAPGALYATCTEPPPTPDRQAYSWHVESEWAERHRDGDLSDEGLLDRMNETLEGPFPYEPVDE